MFAPPQKFISPALAATFLRVPRTTLDLFVKKGLLRVHRAHPTAHRQIEFASIEELIAAACRAQDIPMHPLPVEIHRFSPFMCAAEVARAYGYTERHVRHLAESGVFPGFKVGRAWRFWPADVRLAPSNETPKQITANTGATAA